MDTTLKLGVIGCGQRGCGMIHGCLSVMDNVDVVAVSDCYEDKMENAVKPLLANGKKKPAFFTDYEKMLNKNLIDAVYISAAWEAHSQIAVKAMKQGIIAALEVGGAYNLEECWELVKTYNETGTPFMFMENCCYDRSELLGTALVRRGILGEVVHCSGAYSHDLREEIASAKKLRHYRLRNYLARNCDNYPTHEIGPIAKVLNINRGNRMTKLVSMASKAAGMEEYINSHKNDLDPDLTGKRFNQGDIVDTLISCENGETIRIRLDTTLPRYYNRDFTINGTKGLYQQMGNMCFLDGDAHESFDVNDMKEKFGNADKYKEFLPEYWKKITEEEKKAGHGGMDMFMMREFVSAALNNKPMPIDVYDGALWMSITALSANSITLGSAPVTIPDFTEGRYLLRKPCDVVKLV